MTEIVKMKNLMERYDSLKENLDEDVHVLMAQSYLLSMVFEIVERKIYEDLTTDDKKFFFDNSIETLEEFIILGNKVQVGLNTLVMINHRIGQIAKKYGCYDMLQVQDREEMLKEIIRGLDKEEHTEFLQQLLKLKESYSL